ncbi:hypothetical protein [Helicobacter sp. MIT 99-5507]|uniref:hypothetical protein n=1 Tax=Helicobacter sp. MIT 99-5507 TaxID=152489 RepID=UPI000E1EE5C8|nr:hypothetical protein [Helicobacter sp. MIT 99-5507]RDU58559.1 hypothetical protein CQA42_01870 [Helicobacter sp. MIT 99-5507]
MPNGKIIKKYIDIQEQEKIIKELKLENVSSSYNNKYIRNTPITTWNKKKIIYEQKIEKIDLDR